MIPCEECLIRPICQSKVNKVKGILFLTRTCIIVRNYISENQKNQTPPYFDAKRTDDVREIFGLQRIRLRYKGIDFDVK